MGYSHSWIAARGLSPEALLDALGLRETGRPGELPSRTTPHCRTSLPGSWMVVLASLGASTGEEDGRPRFLDESEAAAPFLATLSVGGEVVAGFLEEHVMASRAAAWDGGARRWSLRYDPERRPDRLLAEGSPPAELGPIEASLREAQRREPDGADRLFEIPLELAKAITGFRGDEDEREYEELELSRPVMTRPGPRRSLLSRLLGR